MNVPIEWLGHAGFLLRGEMVVCIDPFKVRIPEPVDVILITHQHYDHCSPEDIDALRKESTLIYAPADCAVTIPGAKAVRPGDTFKIGKITVEAVPAYNIDKQFHQKEKGWVGYIIEMDGIRIYHAGDTDQIPEMEDIIADVVMLPVGGTYTMTAEEAAAAVKVIGPKIAIPMHYGTIVGTVGDAERFRDLCDCEVRVLK